MAIALAAAPFLISGLSTEVYADKTMSEQTIQVQDDIENAVSIEEAVVEPIEAQVYTGEEISPAPVVTLDGSLLIPEEDYTVFYENNVEIGEATVTITGIGDYDGSVTVHFNIIHQPGWAYEDEGKCYYSEKGKKVTGWQEIDGNWYFFNPTGYIQTGWRQIRGKWYFFDTEGRMQTGWQQVGKWFFFDESGVMQTGWLQLGSKWYFLNKNGAMQTGWKQVGSKWYYFDNNGRMQTGWKQVGSKWYYFETSGAMKTGWKIVSGQWYFFNTDGRMQTSWKQIGSKWYYFGKDGAMKTGWIKVGSKWYLFADSGAMESENPISSKWQTVKGSSYLFLNDGIVSNTGLTKRIKATGRYLNWDGVTNVAQFKGADGRLRIAVNDGDSVNIYQFENGKLGSAVVTLEKQHSKFGTVLCDKDGNYYLVTGEENETNDDSIDTVFISKFSSSGAHILTIGDNDDECTKIPFEGGGCAAAIYGDILTVYYAQEMYSGHQADAILSVNIKTMAKVDPGNFYNSHSFAQRVIATADGFTYMSEGDCYDRAFTTYSVQLSGDEVVKKKEANLFDFWVQAGTFDTYNMSVLNDNFAHMGGIAELSDGRIAFVAQSARSLNSDAAWEEEDIFIQIYDPFGDLNTASGYTTSGTRSGLAGKNGSTQVTNYGVKWLTDFTDTDQYASNVQIVGTDDDRIIVLYELEEEDSYKGVYYMILDDEGNVLTGPTLYNSFAKLNPCEMPVYADHKVYWTGNRYRSKGEDDLSETVCLNMLDVR